MSEASFAVEEASRIPQVRSMCELFSRDQVALRALFSHRRDLQRCVELSTVMVQEIAMLFLGSETLDSTKLYRMSYDEEKRETGTS